MFINMSAFCEKLRISSNGYFTRDIKTQNSWRSYPVIYNYITQYFAFKTLEVHGRSCKLHILGDETKEIVVTAPSQDKQFEELRDRVVLLSCDKLICNILTSVAIFRFDKKYPIGM